MRLNILVGEIMTKNVKKVDVNDSIEKAAQVMRDEKIGSVVVMGEKNVKGIVTTMDIVYKHVAGKKGQNVGDIMSTNLIIVAPNVSIEEASRQMIKHNIEKLLVFDNNQLVGIITNNDVLKVEPALVEILLERQKIGAPRPPAETAITECESCGNYSDDIEEVNGVYMCAECRLEA
jgi:predicted transcriptional regulator